MCSRNGCILLDDIIYSCEATPTKQVDIVCKCGHSEKFHISCSPPIGDDVCIGAGLPKDVGLDKYCQCYGFRPDNLNTVELLAKKRKLI